MEPFRIAQRLQAISRLQNHREYRYDPECQRRQASDMNTSMLQSSHSTEFRKASSDAKIQALPLPLP